MRSVRIRRRVLRDDLKVRWFADRQQLAVCLLSAPTTWGRCVDRFGAGLDVPGQPGVSPTHAAHESAVLFGRSHWPSPRRWNGTHRDAKRAQFGLCDAAPGWGDEEDLVGWERLQRILDCLHWVGVAELEVD